MYRGLIIKESIGDETIFDAAVMEKTELWKTNEAPKYWTAVYFSSEDEEFPEKLSNAITGNWYADMKAGNEKIIVFHGRVLRYIIGSAEEKKTVLDHCRKMGIPERQLDWSE